MQVRALLALFGIDRSNSRDHAVPVIGCPRFSRSAFVITSRVSMTDYPDHGHDAARVHQQVASLHKTQCDSDVDPSGESYCFERGALKASGGDGWADVWKRHHFAWEYKGTGKDLDAAFDQLRQYALALENPSLLIVSDIVRFRIRTNWTNSVSRTYEFGLDDLADAATRNLLKWALSDPEQLRPGETRQSLTERAAASFAAVAQVLRERGHDPQRVALFVNRLVFCMFADDVGLLPEDMFSRMLRACADCSWCGVPAVAVVDEFGSE